MLASLLTVLLSPSECLWFSKNCLIMKWIYSNVLLIWFVIRNWLSRCADVLSCAARGINMHLSFFLFTFGGDQVLKFQCFCFWLTAMQKIKMFQPVVFRMIYWSPNCPCEGISQVRPFASKYRISLGPCKDWRLCLELYICQGCD